MIKKCENYDKETLDKIIQKCFSIAGVCRELNIKAIGGNYKTIKYYINAYNLDISHFTGKGWNIGERYNNVKNKIPLSEILVENSTYTNTHLLKKRLVKEGYFEYKCNECGLTEWCNKPISLHLDHINGDNLDHRIENLRLLCPNCHSQTETYCSKNKKSSKNTLRIHNFIENKDFLINRESKKQKHYCECGKEIEKRAKKCRECYKKDRTESVKQKNHCACGKVIKNESVMCLDCLHKHNRKVERPSYEQLILEINESSYTSVGKKYNVAAKTIKKWKLAYERI